jgi:hypothetical protein
LGIGVEELTEAIGIGVYSQVSHLPIAVLLFIRPSLWETDVSNGILPFYYLLLVRSVVV